MSETIKKSAFAAACESVLFGGKKIILFLAVLITVFMAYMASQLQVDAGFKKQLPLDHEYMKTFLQYEEDFGGANRVLVALVDESGDMFNDQFFEKLEKVTDQVFFIPGVSRASVKSIFTPNVRFVEVVEDGFAGGNVIPSDFAPSAESFDVVRANIVKSGVLGRLVAEDFNGAMVWADLLENDPQTGEKIDYQSIAEQLENIRTKFEGDGQTVHIIGFAKIVGDISKGAISVLYFFALAILITAVLLFWYSKHWKLTLYPIVCSITAVIWQLGFLKILGMGIDPMNILTPFLVFAIGVSHGVQMISGWTDQLVHQKGNHNANLAARGAFCALLAPGIIALLSDTIGFATIYFINIRIIQELAITATIGVALIIITNMVILPLLLSGVKMKNFEAFCAKCERNAHKEGVWHGIAKFAKNPLATLVVLLAMGLFAIGYFKGQEMQIGDSQAGVPELRPEARYNQDAMKISGEFSLGVDMINVIAETTADACTESFKAMENIDRFAWHMANVEGVQKVITLPQIAKIITAGWNEGNIKWRELSRNNYVMRQSLSGIDTDTGLLNRDCSAMPVTIFTEDHKATTINNVVDAVHAYQAANPAQVNEEGELQDGEVKFRLATGNAGVMAATNDVVKGAQMPMLFMVYGAIILLCLVTFRSIAGTISIVLPLFLVSTLAYALMAYLGIGLKVNTLPVVALGVGIGVDYGIYIFSKLQSLLRQGMSLFDAYKETLQLTGKAVFFTAMTLGIGVGTWMFSDLKFQADMGILLAFMFILNMIGALLLLPALAYWLMPKHRKAGA